MCNRKNIGYYGKRLLSVISVLLFVCISFFAMSGSMPTGQKIALLKGNYAYNQLHFANAAEYFSFSIQGMEKPPLDVLLKLSDCYWRMRDFSKSKSVLSTIYEKYPNNMDEQTHIRLSELEARAGNYSRASMLLNGISRYQKKAGFYGDKSKIESLKADSADWTIDPVSFNTNYREFSPLVVGNNLFFSSNIPNIKSSVANGWDGSNYARIWKIPISEIKTNENTSSALDSINKYNPQKSMKIKHIASKFEFGDVEPMSPRASTRDRLSYVRSNGVYRKAIPIVSQLKYNVAVASVDSLQDIYFSTNIEKERKSAISQLKIMEGRLYNNKIDFIKPVFQSVDNTSSSMHPAVNRTGTLMIFSSNRKDKKDDFDLYFCKRATRDNSWNEPILLSELINTEGNEVFPTINNEYLYFSNDTRAGLGGLDIYRIKLNDALNGTGTVEPLAFPINSSADDFGYTTLTEKGDNGFFTSDRGVGGDNIYKFNYLHIIPSAQISGVVRDKKNMEPLQDATVFMYDKTNDLVYVAKTDKDGRYLFDIKNPGEFILKPIKKDYTEDDCLSIHVEKIKGTNETITPRDLQLDLQHNERIVVEDLFYDFDKWNIRPDASIVLDNLAKILKKNPGVPVELGSHTDCRGSFEYNDKLSQRRAESAVAYLIGKGVESNRITAKGYGEHKLVNRCADGISCTEEEHQKNRRTEVTVMDNSLLFFNSIDPDLYKDKSVIKPTELPVIFFDKCK